MVSAVVEVQRRSWPEITIEILEATWIPTNKMRIMYKSNLNFERFNKYFCDLLKKGFIEEWNSSNRLLYKTTERGRTLLEVLKKAQGVPFEVEWVDCVSKGLDRLEGEGIDVEELIKQFDNAEKAIKQLLEDGEVFEIRPGKLKVLE